MQKGDDEWFDRMPWVPAIPGNKTYVLQEAQKEIERLRQEIRRLRVENRELRVGMNTTIEPPGTEEEQKPSNPPREGGTGSPGNGDYLYITGVVRVLGHA
jgi:hypothetical protein